MDVELIIGLLFICSTPFLFYVCYVRDKIKEREKKSAQINPAPKQPKKKTIIPVAKTPRGEEPQEPLIYVAEWLDNISSVSYLLLQIYDKKKQKILNEIDEIKSKLSADLKGIEAKRNKIHLHKKIAAILALIALGFACWGVIVGINYLVYKGETETRYVDDYDNMQAITRERTVVTVDEVCYITTYGEKFHNLGCGYLSKSSYQTTTSSAVARGYTACSKCWKQKPTAMQRYTDYVPTRTKIEKAKNDYEDIIPTTVAVFFFISVWVIIFITGKVEDYYNKKYDREKDIVIETAKQKIYRILIANPTIKLRGEKC